MQSTTFVIASLTNYDYWSDKNGWVAEHLAQEFTTKADAEARIAKWHPEFRERLQPEVYEQVILLDGTRAHRWA